MVWQRVLWSTSRQRHEAGTECRQMGWDGMGGGEGLGRLGWSMVDSSVSVQMIAPAAGSAGRIAYNTHELTSINLLL